MPKKTALSDALAHAARGHGSARIRAPESKTTAGASVAASPHRVGKVNVTGYFDPAVKQSLRLIQAKHPDRTVQNLLAEALNDLFAKYNVPQAANLAK